MQPSIAKNISLLKWFNFWTDFQPYNVIMILYFAQVTGSYTLTTSLYSIGAISSMLFEVPTGMLADRLGRKWTVILGVAMGIIGLGIDAFANSYAVFVPASILIGLAYALQSGNNEALLYESVEDKNTYMEISGKVGGMFQLGLGCAALLTAGLTLFLSFRTIFAISIIPQTIALCIALFFIEPLRHTDKFKANVFADLREAAKLFRTNSKLRLLSLGQVISYGVGEATWGVESVFMALFLTPSVISALRFFQHLLAFIASRSIAFWRKRMDDLHILISSQLICKTMGLITFAFPSILSPILLTLGNYPWGVSDVAVRSLLQHQFTNHQRATMGSLSAFAGKLLLGIALLAIGWSADHIGITKTLLIAQLILVGGIGFHLALFRSQKKTPAVS